MGYPNEIIEDLFQKYEIVMRLDHHKYKNHVYRVFLNSLLLNAGKNNEDKYAIAAVFHDIGIWTNHTIDYLDPSIEQAKIYLIETGRQQWIEEISGMIYWHHKLSKYKGNYEETVSNFRKADWVDVSLGLLSFGLDKHKTKIIRQKFPNEGFHVFLLKNIMKNFLKHPLNPLPMFKK